MDQHLIQNQDPNNYWEQLERLEKLIRASELKAGVLFSFHSLILGLFFDRLSNFQELFDQNILFVILVSLWLLCVIISIFFCFKCFMPRIEKNMDKNVFFFKDAAMSFGNIESYTDELIKVCGSKEKLFRRLGEQIHIESVIIDKKFKSVKQSIRFFALSQILILVSFIIWLILG